jgi:hypothetical protein
VSFTLRVSRRNSDVPISRSSWRICKLERRLLDAEPLGCTGKVRLFADCNEITKMPEFHGLTIRLGQPGTP